jgi:hypothetical protein
MYINLKLIHEKSLTVNDVMMLQIIKQNKIEDNEDMIAWYITDNQIADFEEQGLVTYVKKKKKSDTNFMRMRTTTKANKLLELFETPELEPGDDQMFQYLCDMYLTDDDPDRVVGNKKKTRMYCAIFRKRMNLSLHEMYWLCMTFLQEYPYTKKLEYIFFNSNKNRHGKFENNMEDSPLYQYLDQHRAKVEQVWELRIEKKDK